jgi:hypothetical protein
MKLYFEKDGLKSLIPDYVDSRYWSIYKEYRQSDEYREKDVYEKFEYLIREFGAEIVENLKKMEEINKTNEDKIVYIGWMARNQYENTGISSVIDVYSEYPEYKRSDNQKMIYWSGHQIASIKTKTHLFGEIGIEPRKVKITIEKL